MQGLASVRKGILVLAMAALTIPALAADNAALQKSVQGRLEGAKFNKVSVAADTHGVVTLTGTVDRLQAKLDAEKKAKKAAGVREIDNQIQVAGKDVPDADLQKSLTRALSYDRAGYGNVFDQIVATVRNGVVTLDGAVHWDPDKSSALALVANRPGVKGVVDNIRVLPVSPYDEEIRVSVLRAIYGNSVLSKYGADQAAPIRIIVERGRVSLYGVVDSELDRNLAGMVANGVPGIFRVENHLITARS